MTRASAAAIQIRTVRPDDLPALLPLCLEHAAFERAACSDDGQLASWEHELQAPRPRLWIWLAWQGRQALGYASATLDYSTWRAREFLHLDCLYMRESCRGAGLGQALLDTVIAQSRQLGCDELQWQTPQWNTRAIAFYARNGALSTNKARFCLRLD